MSHQPFQDHTRWRSAIGTLVVATLCLVPIAVAAGVVIQAGPTSPIGVLALLSAAVWTGLAAVLTRIALPVQASIHIDELGIKVEGRRQLVLPWTSVRTVGIRRWRGREHVLLRPDRSAPLPVRLPPHIHLRPVQHVLILELDGWQHPDHLSAALRAYAGDRWDNQQLLPLKTPQVLRQRTDKRKVAGDSMLAGTGRRPQRRLGFSADVLRQRASRAETTP